MGTAIYLSYLAPPIAGSHGTDSNSPILAAVGQLSRGVGSCVRGNSLLGFRNYSLNLLDWVGGILRTAGLILYTQNFRNIAG